MHPVSPNSLPETDPVSPRIARRIELFCAAATRAADILETQDRSTQLLLYALYNQGSHGDAPVKSPRFFARKKCEEWTAWAKQRGKDPDIARKEYINLVNRLER